VTTLHDILTAIDWVANIRASLGIDTTVNDIDSAATRIAVWSKQLEQADEGNPALCFVREMQHSIQHSGALIGLCLYKPSAASSRTLVESCIYYTYFRTHPEELATLVLDSKYYIGKAEIIDYHKQHTAEFKAREQTLGLLGRLELWYSRTSAVVHGQIPGTWNTHRELAETSYSKDVQEKALMTLLDGVSIVNDLLLCTVARRLWTSFAPEAKTFLTKGMSAAKRQALNLDTK
jgi:hypothetical protein